MFDDLKIGNYVVDWFSAIVGLTVLIVIGFSIWINKYDNSPLFKKHPNLKVTFFILLISLFLLIGSRLLAYAELIIVYDKSEIATNNTIFSSLLYNTSGGSWYGGFLLSAIFIYIFSVFNKNNKTRVVFLNYNTLILCLFYIVGRQACFISADGCYGIPTNHPFGMRFLHGIKPTILTVHPTPLYESLSTLGRFSNTLNPLIST